ncbi:MAG: alpha/beta hydrolase [Gammaproteobacteria bacterium]|nr:alpha/beta hydrolase [Gammaproteobacteria bacterium]
MEIKINDRKVFIYFTEPLNKTLPIIVNNSFESDESSIWNNSDKNFIFINVLVKDWEKEMSPYDATSAFKRNEVIKSDAKSYLKELESIILEVKDKLGLKPEFISIIGYSLAGLFSIYSLFNSKLFKRCASISGSLWYPDFIDYIKNNEICDVDRIYLSLGNKEANSKNKVLSQVLDKTKEAYNYFKDKNIDSFFELNEGGHFVNEDERIIKGIKYILKSED